MSRIIPGCDSGCDCVSIGKYLLLHRRDAGFPHRAGGGCPGTADWGPTMRKLLAVLTIAASGAFAPVAQASDNAGKAVAIALPIAAGGIALLHHRDWQGVSQLGIDTALTVGTVLALKQFVREQRPDHSDFRSFPSLTTAVAFAPASFLWRRYGWQYGAPAY